MPTDSFYCAGRVRGCQQSPDCAGRLRITQTPCYSLLRLLSPSISPFTSLAIPSLFIFLHGPFYLTPAHIYLHIHILSTLVYNSFFPLPFSPLFHPSSQSKFLISVCVSTLSIPTFGIRARAALSCVGGRNVGGYGCNSRVPCRPLCTV